MSRWFAFGLTCLVACSAAETTGPGTNPDTMGMTGPTGPTGMTGPTGATGPTGPGPAVLAELRIDGPTTLMPGATATVTATGILSDGSEIDLTRAATWLSSSSTVARVAAGGQLRAVGEGRTQITAQRGDIMSGLLSVTVDDGRFTADGELRGVWVTRWTYSNAADLQRVVEDVESANLNAIFFQVRGTSDAYYRSTLEPWAARLSGTLGQDPGWDPLAEVIRLAHARGIQVHAWLNTFNAWSGDTAPTPSTPQHNLLAHPEWLCADENGTPMPLGGSGYQFFSPGNPDVRAHVANVALEIATGYEVDGIHFDYIRYPGRQFCHDAASEAAFTQQQAANPALTWEDFQRSNITEMVGNVQSRLTALPRPVALTVASWGIYTNPFGWSNVSRGRDDYFQDAHRWAKEGLVDALCPMAYWELTSPKGGRTDFATLADHHVGAANEGQRYTFMGISAGHSTDEVLAQVQVARDAGATGFVFFELRQLRDHLSRLATGPFAEKATPPTLFWKQ